MEALLGIGKLTAFKVFLLRPEAVKALLLMAEGRMDEARTELNNFLIALYSPYVH